MGCVMVTAKNFTNTSDFLSQKQFDEHITLYKGYVGKVNEITNDLVSFQGRGSANATYSPYRALKKGETYALDGMILHELYFPLLGNKETRPGEKTGAILETYFGGYDNWKEDFTACGMAARGWAILLYDQRTDTFRNILLDWHDQGYIAGAYPLVVMDVYEHAYFTDYGTKKDEYIKRFIHSLRWDLVERKAAGMNKG